jgi:hypothetical protein
VTENPVYLANPTRARLDEQAVILAEIAQEHLLAMIIVSRALRAEKRFGPTPNHPIVALNARLGRANLLWRDDNRG